MKIFRMLTAAVVTAVTLTGCGQKAAAPTTWTSDNLQVTYTEQWTDITPVDTGGMKGISLARSDSEKTMSVGIFDATVVYVDAKTLAEKLIASKEDNADYNITYAEKTTAEGEIFGYSAWYAEWMSTHASDAPSRSRVYYIQQDEQTIGVTLYAADASDFEKLTEALPEITLTIGPLTK